MVPAFLACSHPTCCLLGCIAFFHAVRPPELAKCQWFQYLEQGRHLANLFKCALQAVILWYKGVPIYDHPKYNKGHSYGTNALNLLEAVGYKGAGEWMELQSTSKLSNKGSLDLQKVAAVPGCPFRFVNSTTYPWH